MIETVFIVLGLAVIAVAALARLYKIENRVPPSRPAAYRVTVSADTLDELTFLLRTAASDMEAKLVERSMGSN
jgi:hypothetical protein